MKLFNSIIEQIPKLVGNAEVFEGAGTGLSEKVSGKRGEKGEIKTRIYPYTPDLIWPETEQYEMVLQRDTAYELGADGRNAVMMTLVTTNPAYFSGNEVVVMGPELQEIKKDAPYARIVLLKTGDIESDDEDDTETAFRAIQSMDFIKYHVFPKDFMVRTSGMQNREQVRVSKNALKNGVSFEKIGNTFIRHYLENEHVLEAKVIFVTAKEADFEGLRIGAKKASDITSSLSQILKGLSTDCGSCGLKEICDEVEGMKELHFGRK